MKWYKKQLDKLKKLKKNSVETKETVIRKNITGHSFDTNKKWSDRTNYRSPVAASKLSRPKTDIH